MIPTQEEINKATVIVEYSAKKFIDTLKFKTTTPIYERVEVAIPSTIDSFSDTANGDAIIDLLLEL